MKEELTVKAIENGTVIDHIQADKLYKILSIIGIENFDTPVFFGNNLPSKKYGTKAIIKIADRYFADDEINKITLVAPQAKINVIKNFEVVEKRVLTVPSEITGIAKCGNPKCITNHQPVPTRFATVADNGKLKLHCHFCEKMTDAENVVILAKN